MAAKKKQTRGKKRTVYIVVAIPFNTHENPLHELETPDTLSFDVQSARQHGDYSCFVGTNQEDVVQQALAAKAAWDENTSGRGPYHLFLGTIAQAVNVPEIKPKYRLKNI